VRIYADAPRAATALPGARENVSVAIRFSNGAIGHLLYYSTGDPATGKEMLEVAGGGMSASMRDFKEVVLWKGGKKRRWAYGGGKGHAEEIEHFLGMVRGTVRPSMKFQSILETTSATLAVGESLRTGAPVDL
jgi:predicted dehydrogenase